MMAHLKTRTVGGERRYDVRWRERGKSRSRTFSRRADADRFRLDIERRAQLGTLYEETPLTLGEARDGWRSRWMIGKAASTVARKDEAWPHVASLEEVPLCDLSPLLLGDAIAAAARVAPRQAQIALATVKQILRDAQGRDQRIQPTTLAVKAPAYDEREPVFLTFPEVELLAEWCTQPNLIVFLALSGLRIGEALALREVDIDRADRSLVVARSARKGIEGPTKTRKRRRVPLCDIAWQALLEQLVARPSSVKGLVFPTPTGLLWDSDNFRERVFAKATRRAVHHVPAGRGEDFARVTLHDLRHTFASLMIAASANPMQIAEALGHTDRNGRPDPTLVWRRYGHLYPGSAQEAVTRLDAHLEALAS